MSAMPQRPQVFVHLLPSLIPPGCLRGGIAVVIDVLRATTVMVQALASGIDAIIPCLEIEEARDIAMRLGRETTILGGERRGLPIERFDLGNSPGSYTPEVCDGKTLVITTTNGTRAIHASLDSERILVAAFTNAAATASAVVDSGLPIHILCAGTDGQISFEDALLAGCLMNTPGFRMEPRNDEARIVASLWSDCEPTTADETALGRVLAQGRGGRRVSEIGLAADLLDASALDRLDLVAELKRDPLRIVRVR